LLAIGVVLVTRYSFQPHDLEPAEKIRAEHFSAAFWWYLGANACIGASLAGLPEQVARAGQKDSCGI
jgi:hypothetical protein